MEQETDKSTESTERAKKPVVYEIQIDKHSYKLTNPEPTGRDLLKLAGKVPVEQFAIYLKVLGRQPQRVDLDQKVDLREPGTERFVTLPLDQTEGLGCRRDFSLPQEDAIWLESLQLRYDLLADGGVLRVVIHDYPLPSGYNLSTVAVSVRVDPGYPDTQIDMVYFLPDVLRQDGRPIAAICTEGFSGKPWQRWSRHRTPANPWRPGIDNLSTHFALIDHWLTRELVRA